MSKIIDRNGDRTDRDGADRDRADGDGHAGPGSILPGDSPTRRRITLQVKSNGEWIDWFDRFAKFLGVGKSTAVDIAVERLARQHKFEKPPKR